MGYINNFLMYKDLINSSDELGVDGVLVVDIPGELSLKDYGIDNKDLDIISLVSPTTSKERIQRIAKNVLVLLLRNFRGSQDHLILMEMRLNKYQYINLFQRLQ